MKIQDILTPLNLRSGAGGSFENGLCVMEAVSWLGGETCSDTPDCACPVLGKFAIMLNDYLSNENRQKLVPLAFEMLGTRSKGHEVLRAEFLLVQVAVRVLSDVFDSIGLSEIASEYRNVKTADDVRIVSQRAKRASAAKAAKAADYASAAKAAKAADAASRAAAYAAYADNASNAAYAAARQETLLKCIPILQEAIALGPNGAEVTDETRVRAVSLAEFVTA